MARIIQEDSKRQSDCLTLITFKLFKDACKRHNWKNRPFKKSWFLVCFLFDFSQILCFDQLKEKGQWKGPKTIIKTFSPVLPSSSLPPFSSVSSQAVRFSDFSTHGHRFGFLYHDEGVEPFLPILLLLRPSLQSLLIFGGHPPARITGKAICKHPFLYFCIVQPGMEVSWGEKPIDLNSMIPGRWFFFISVILRMNQSNQLLKIWGYLTFFTSYVPGMPPILHHWALRVWLFP